MNRLLTLDLEKIDSEMGVIKGQKVDAWTQPLCDIHNRNTIYNIWKKDRDSKQKKNEYDGSHSSLSKVDCSLNLQLTYNIKIESCSKLEISVTEHLIEVVDKLSTTAVVFFRFERILKCKHLYGA